MFFGFSLLLLHCDIVVQNWLGLLLVLTILESVINDDSDFVAGSLLVLERMDFKLQEGCT